MTRHFWHEGLGLAVVTTWSVGASALDVVLSGAIERSATNSRVELLATLVVPLDEWLGTLPALSRVMQTKHEYQRAWEEAEGITDEIRLESGDDPFFWAQTLVPGDPPATLPRTEPAAPTPPPTPSARQLTPPKLNASFIKALMKACSLEFGSASSELENLSDRARWSALLPELQLKGGRNTDQTLRLTPTDAEPDRYQVVGGDGVRFEGQVRWSFSQLVFARDELTVARLRGSLDAEKRKRQQQTMAALAKWYGAWMSLSSVSADVSDRVEAWIAESALRAELDWLNQRWFSAHVPSAPDWSDLQER
jgi:hypothetical protein